MVESKLRTVSCERALTAQVCTPACRLVVVECWADDARGELEYGSTVYPVVAVLARVVTTYSRQTSATYPDESGTEQQLLQDGWRLERQECCTSALIVHEECGDLVRHDDRLFLADSAVNKLVCAPWPAEEDEARLADVVAELKERARDRLTWLRSRQAKVKASVR
jgi:hypothetical protein